MHFGGPPPAEHWAAIRRRLTARIGGGRRRPRWRHRKAGRLRRRVKSDVRFQVGVFVHFQVVHLRESNFRFGPAAACSAFRFPPGFSPPRWRANPVQRPKQSVPKRENGCVVRIFQSERVVQVVVFGRHKHSARRPRIRRVHHGCPKHQGNVQEVHCPNVEWEKEEWNRVR